MADKLTIVMSDRYGGEYLFSGKVPVKGFDVEFVLDRDRARDEMLHRLNYDIVEMPISNYLIARDLGIPLTAIAAFPSLFFPQAGIMVNRQAGVHQVDDLLGKRVGVNGFGYNPAAWLLGIFFHQYDLPVERITWVEDFDWATAPNSPCRLPYPRSRRFTIEQEKSLRQLLEEGRIEALILPGAGLDPTENIAPLFPDSLRESQKYVESTGVFPVNTVLTIKKETVETNPGLAESLLEAHREAWQRYVMDTPDDSRHQGLSVGELRAMGLFPRPDGFRANRDAVLMLVHYCFEQGVIRNLLEPEELFVATD
jgi:4,5-dihydroxyphthalate decarboxylase